MLIFITIICQLFLFTSAVTVKGNPSGSDSERLAGVNTIHKIDKDTIITRNLNLERKNKGKIANHKKTEEEGEPDWSYSAIPEEINEYVKQFKANMSECLKEVQANDKRTIRRLSPNRESPVHGECLIACVLKRNNVIVHGKIHKDNLLSLVGKFYAKDTKLMKKLEKNVDRCINSAVRVSPHDECALAAHLNQCTNDLMATNKHKITLTY